MTPNDRKYTKSHEWIKVEGSTAVVGISDHAQKALGDLTFVESMAPGRKVKQGEPCGVVESVKAASDIYAPVSGEIAGFNKSLESEPGAVNEDPYNRGWILKLTNIDAGQLSSLMDAAAYDASVKDDSH